MFPGAPNQALPMRLARMHPLRLHLFVWVVYPLYPSAVASMAFRLTSKTGLPRAPAEIRTRNPNLGGLCDIPFTTKARRYRELNSEISPSEGLNVPTTADFFYCCY